MEKLSGRRAFRIVRAVQITRVEVVSDFPDGNIITPGHKEPLHGWNLAQDGRVVSMEEIALPDEATLAQAPHIQVEYVTADMSREHDGISVYIPLPLIEILGSVEAAFELLTDEDRSLMVYHDESFAELYTADGDSWEGDDALIPLLPGQQTDLHAFVRYVVDPTKTPLVTRFALGEYVVEWECLMVSGERIGPDDFDLYRGKDHLGSEHMHREVDEDALLAIAARIAPGKPLEDIVGMVS